MLQDMQVDTVVDDIETDLCIIGAGAAGITLARQFDGSSLRVCLVESGGLEFSEEQQALYKAEVVGRRYPTDVSRLRYFGGTTNHWTGVCGLLDPMDFEPRPWMGSPGWPISRNNLLPYYQRTHDILDLGDFNYDPDDLAPGITGLGFDEDKLVPRVLRHSVPTRFASKYGQQLLDSDNILGLIHANVVDFNTNKTGTDLHSIQVASLTGNTASIKARVFVLACGGLENPRLMLSASGPHGGLGNRHDQVGRYFSDHVHFNRMGMLVADGQWWRDLQLERSGDNRPFVALALGEKVQREEQLVNHRTGFWATDCPDGVRTDRVCLSLIGECEQVSRADNRVTLSSQRDALGMRRIRLHWTISERERKTMLRALVLLAEELGRMGLASVRLEPILSPDQFTDRIWIGSHHMGTTRMSERPEDGVVDEDCRVHGIDNLYVAGSSVFPASGQVNPTNTIVALALRLADHLQQRL